MTAIGAPRNDHGLKAIRIYDAPGGSGFIEPLADFGIYHGRLPPFNLSFRLNLAGRNSGHVAASPIKL
jgi:hypothetical protein